MHFQRIQVAWSGYNVTTHEEAPDRGVAKTGYRSAAEGRVHLNGLASREQDEPYVLGGGQRLPPPRLPDEPAFVSSSTPGRRFCALRSSA